MAQPAAVAMTALIRVYKVTLSPAFAAVGVRCRHEPTCSTYAIDCIDRYGAWAGGWLTLSRLCRCHPLGSSGYDPAPAVPRKAPWWAPWRLGDWAWTTRRDDAAQAR